VAFCPLLYIIYASFAAPVGCAAAGVVGFAEGSEWSEQDWTGLASTIRIKFSLKYWDGCLH